MKPQTTKCGFALSALASTALFMGGCGVWIEEKDSDHPDTVSSNSRGAHGNGDSSGSGRGSNPDLPQRLRVSGYILNGFEVQVDGQTYSDLEHFYTEEIDRLDERVREAGFDETWQVSFDANIGFADLWENMAVFIATTEDRGFQARTWVNGDGAFTADFPADAKSNTFRMRAVKRLQLRLERSGERKVVCYNFSAIERAVPFKESDKPVVLSQFTTQITAYDCRVNSNSGLIVPENPRKS